MNGLGYYPYQERVIPKRKYRPVKSFFLLLVLSLVFLPSTTTTFVQAAQSTPVDQIDFSPVSSYLAVTNDAPRPPVYAKSFLLLDSQTAEVVVGDNINQSVPIASITKMVTALVARKLFSLDDIVEVSQYAAGIQGSGIDLMPGEKITVSNLLKGLLIQSGNDAAFALAEHYSRKSENYQLFVDQMNQYVRGVGLSQSVFGDPAGLDDEDGRSTALELAHIARLVLQDPVLKEIVKTPNETIYSINKYYKHELKNSNRLVQGESPFYLPNALGIKTGFTNDAGHCLVSAYQSENGELVGVVLNTAEYTSTASSSESRKLFLWANRYTERRQY